jgi:small subunit ribosomal protein S29
MESDSEQMYIQPHLTQLLLQRAVSSNESILKSLRLNHDHGKPLTLGSNATLYDLAQLGARDFHLSWPAWQALFKELSVSGANARPPVLIAADGVDHWMGPTLYRNREHKPIHAHQLSLVKQFVNLLFSTSAPDAPSTFANGGMILFSTSASNSPAYPTFELLLSQVRAVQNHHIQPSSADFPVPKPYSNPDEHVLSLSAFATAPENVQLTDLTGLSREESRGYLEYFAKSGLLHQRVTDVFVSEMRGLSGGGVVGELARLGKRITA